jgi:enoyl-CoA hydratase/carnithine racemase
VLTGRRVTTDEALAMGAVTRRFADRDTLHDAVIEFATELSGRTNAVLRGAVDPLRNLAVPHAMPELEYQWPERT